MGYWPKHPKKELQELLEEFDRAGWRIERGRGYYKALCPCGIHRKWIHLSPSGAHYKLDAQKWLHRQPCYTKGA